MTNWLYLKSCNTFLNMDTVISIEFNADDTMAHINFVQKRGGIFGMQIMDENDVAKIKEYLFRQAYC